MNHGLSTRSALVRAAKTGLQRERRAQIRQDSAIVLSICTVVIGVFLLVQFIAQVLP